MNRIDYAIYTLHASPGQFVAYFHQVWAKTISEGLCTMKHVQSLIFGFSTSTRPYFNLNEERKRR